MRNLSQNEILSLNSLLRMETNELAVSKAILRTVSDKGMREMTAAGISTCESRINTLQQFLVENQVVQGGVQ